MADRIVKVVLRGDVAGFKSSMAAAGKSVTDTADRLTGATKSSKQFREGLTTVGTTAGRVGAAAAAGLGLVVKSAMDWESAWTGVTKTVDATATMSLPKLEGQLRSLTHELPQSHAQIAAVAEAAGQLGVKADDVASFTKVMVELGDTTNLSAEDAATAIARFNNVMGIANSEAERVGSTLVDLGNNSATTEAEIMVLGQRMAAAGSIAGLSGGDVLGFAAALSSVGVEAEAGGTAMSKVFLSMRDAVIDGGAKLDTFAQTAGTTADEFAAKWKSSPAEALEMFIAGLGRLNASGQSTTSVFKALGLTDQRLSRALLSTAQAGDLLTRSVDMGNQAWEKNNALAVEAGKRYGTTASQAKIAWNSIKDSMIDFGQAALPVVAKSAQGLASFSRAMSALPAPLRAASVGMMGITAVLGGGLWFTAKTVKSVSEMRAALENLSISAGRAGRALSVLGKTGGAAVVALAVASAVDEIAKSTDRAIPGVEQLTSDILNLSSAEGARRLATDLGDVKGALDKVADPGMLNRIDSLYSKIPLVGHEGGILATSMLGLGGASLKAQQGLREAEATISATDKALAGIVAAGSPERAKAAFEDLARMYGLNASEQKALLDQMPQYKEALAAAANSEKLATSGADAYGASLDGLTDGMDGAATKAMTLKNAMDLLFGNAQDADAALVSWKRGIQGLTKELKGGADAFNVNTKAGQDNRDAVRGQLGTLRTWAEAQYEVDGSTSKLTQRLLRGREAIIRQGEAAGISRTQMAEYLKELGFTPKDIRTTVALMGTGEAKKTLKDLGVLADVLGSKKPIIKIDADGTGAAGVMNRLKDMQIPDKLFRVTAVYGTAGSQYDTRPSAGGGRQANGSVLDFFANGSENHVAQIAPAGSWRVWAEPETGGEAYIPLAPAKRERSVDIWRAVGDRLGVQFQEFVAGGLVTSYASGGIGRPSLDDRAEIMRLRIQIRDLTRELAATGKKAVTGLDRQMKQLELQQARVALREARNAPAVERREKARERATKVNDAIGKFDLRTTLPGLDHRDPTMVAVRAQVAEFRKAIRDAGGVWTKSMQKQADELVKTSRAYISQQKALENAKQALEELKATSAQYASQVAGTFNHDIFGNGLAGMALALQADTNDAKAMQAALKVAAGKGLDGGLFQALAASGDLNTAQQMAQLSAAQIAQYEQMFAQRTQVQNSLGSYASDQVYGKQIADQSALISRQTATLDKLEKRLGTLEAAVERGARKGIADTTKKANQQRRVGAR